MVRAHRVVTAVIGAPPENVRAFYTDLRNIVRIHPLVVAVHAGPRIPSAHGYRQDYRITDRIPVGPVVVRTRYRARMTVPAHGEVTAEVRQFPGIRMHTVVTFAAAGDDGTRLTEHMTIEAPRPLASFTAREAVKAHREMLDGIRDRFGG
ncbi:Polyketide cyclase / dehydrase and lipid transport [Mycolicibacterium rutilum]|uniref:Polyketide cyclase / dehydrase and lipid transport n=1 Tax=Mycolicibacterium rutilum TaxID=370526 RepID=A0A1H6KTE5_MYCRU|nr:SRPBCC family protein [Mycolicibacterium rutilum]SEH79139.1 Polyketide cyclase / dehydrase and lipid transport [Mycolicibacterium rutilum]